MINTILLTPIVLVIVSDTTEVLYHELTRWPRKSAGLLTESLDYLKHESTSIKVTEKKKANKKVPCKKYILL